jgi:hypothetical protein
MAARSLEMLGGLAAPHGTNRRIVGDMTGASVARGRPELVDTLHIAVGVEG